MLACFYVCFSLSLECPHVARQFPLIHHDEVQAVPFLGFFFQIPPQISFWSETPLHNTPVAFPCLFIETACCSK